MIQMPSAAASGSVSAPGESGAVDGKTASVFGRTAWDFLTETRWLLFALIPILVLLAVIVVFSIIMYKRAAREGRTFSLMPPRVGEKAADASAQSTVQSTPTTALETPLRAAIEITRQAHAILVAQSDLAAIEHEEALLATLVTFTTSGPSGTRRRASILGVVNLAGGDASMTVRARTPHNLFHQPLKTFLRSEYKKTGKGMCWAAVDGCMRARLAVSESIAAHLMTVDDVRSTPSYIEIAGHHPFASILIAPIYVDNDAGESRVFGVACIDSTETQHYGSVDGYLLALAAAAIGSAWQARGHQSNPW